MDLVFDDTLPEHHTYSPTRRHPQSQPLPTTPWRPILYEQQSGDDSYVPPDFMSHNILYGIIRLHYIPLCCESICIAVQCTIVVLFTLVYYILYSNTTIKLYYTVQLNSTILILIDLILLDIGAVLYRILASSLRSTRIHTISRVIVLITMLAAVSPVLCTLTQSYSSDTIYTLYIILMSIHLITFDYSYIINALPDNCKLYDNDINTTMPANTGNQFSHYNNDRIGDPIVDDNTSNILQSDKLSNTISYNSAIFMSVMLASRFTDIMNVFSILLLSFISYTGLPSLSTLIRRYSLTVYNVLACSLFAITSILLSTIDIQYSISYLLFICILIFIIPCILQYCIRFKQQVSGQWDFDELENEEYS